jgi:F0F1-type ATP synthase assembly protein I
MAKDPNAKRSAADGANTGMAALGYLIAGMAFWGLIGWLVDRWLDSGGIAIAVGVVVGMAGGIYLVVRRFGV